MFGNAEWQPCPYNITLDMPHDEKVKVRAHAAKEAGQVLQNYMAEIQMIARMSRPASKTHIQMQQIADEMLKRLTNNPVNARNVPAPRAKLLHKKHICKFLGDMRKDMPSRGSCCKPYTCTHPETPAVIVKSKQCPCKFFEPLEGEETA
jgi:hypothetical protein